MLDAGCWKEDNQEVAYLRYLAGIANYFRDVFEELKKVANAKAVEGSLEIDTKKIKQGEIFPSFNELCRKPGITRSLAEQDSVNSIKQKFQEKMPMKDFIFSENPSTVLAKVEQDIKKYFCMRGKAPRIKNTKKRK